MPRDIEALVAQQAQEIRELKARLEFWENPLRMVQLGNVLADVEHATKVMHELLAPFKK